MPSKLLYTILLIACAACGKSDEDEFSGVKDMSGKLYVQNEYDGETKQLLPNHDILLQKETAADGNDFLISSKSDKEGLFVFHYLEEKNYKLHAEIKKSTLLDTDILFTADIVSSPKEDLEVILKPDLTKQNGLLIKCADEDNPSGTIPEVSIYIYTSRILAENDNVAVDGTGASYKFLSRLDGSAFKMNLPYGQKLYINSARTVGTKRLKSTFNIVEMEKTGLKTTTLLLKWYP